MLVNLDKSVGFLCSIVWRFAPLCPSETGWDERHNDQKMRAREGYPKAKSRYPNIYTRDRETAEYGIYTNTHLAQIKLCPGLATDDNVQSLKIYNPQHNMFTFLACHTSIQIVHMIQ
jgi:hypothetical protein